MAALQARGTDPESIGMFENGRPSLRALVRVGFGRAPIITSNLRSNLVILALPWTRGLVIVNGLGRHRSSTLLRRVLLGLLRINGRKAIALQNYADYRWARRFGRHSDVQWVPGSGGIVKPVGADTALVLVTRDDKVAVIAPSLARLYDCAADVPPLVVVGCRDAAGCGNALAGLPHHSVGFVDADAILSFGDTFVQPSGYGEGLPHSLADAIVSGMTIMIQKREVERYGLIRLGARVTKIGNGWHIIEPDAALRDALAEPTVTARYLAIFDSALTAQ
jgi:hypothetical protein